MNSEQNDSRAMGMDDGMSGSDSDSVESELTPADVSPNVGFADVSDFENQVILERRSGHDRHDVTHVDLMQEEYSPDEVARLVGTSLDVVMHAIYQGDLKADRQGHNVVCIKHADVAHWLRERAGV